MTISQVSSSFSLIEGKSGGNRHTFYTFEEYFFFGGACRKKIEVPRSAGK